jgi:hypothetical protein
MAVVAVAVSPVVVPVAIAMHDIVDLAGALAWPVAIGLALILYRDQIGPFLGSVGGRIRSVSVLGVELELTELRSVEMSSANQIDQLIAAPAFESSGVDPLAAQNDATDIDYAIVDLGKGRSWLSSHLYIVALLLQRSTTRMQYLVFVSGVDHHRYHFEGVAELGRIRWALAQQYPWLERAFAQAYSELLSTPGGNPQDHPIVSRRGALTTYDSRELRETYLQHCRQAILYTPGDIVDPQGLAATLNDAQNKVSVHLKTRFDQSTRDKIAWGASLAKPSATAGYDTLNEYGSKISDLRSTLCKALNTIIEDGPVYEEQRFSSVYSGAKSSLVPTNPQGVELLWLNRLLLDSVYGRDLASNSMQPALSDSGKLIPRDREWTKVREEDPGWIHARWLDAALVERVMGADLSRVHLRESDLVGKTRQDKARMVLDQSGPVLPIIEESGRFSRMLDRQKLLNAVSGEIAS